MAKALYGHLGSDPLLTAEVARLRRRVRDLEDEVARLRADQAELGPDALHVDEILAVDARQEPALT